MIHPHWPKLRVALTDAERKDVDRVAARVAARYDADRVAHMKFRTGRPTEEVVRDGLGAEMAVAIWSGQPWNRGDRARCDVGEAIEVRNTRRPDGPLMLYTYDHADRRFILATGHDHVYTLVGWMDGVEAMTERYWHPKGAEYDGIRLDLARFIVPQADLAPPWEW